jgi:hypothetical protein
MDSAHGKSAPAKPVRAAPAPDKPALKRVLLGKIVGLFGVDGWVKVES